MKCHPARANRVPAVAPRPHAGLLLGALLACLVVGLGSASDALGARLLGRVPRQLPVTSASPARPSTAPRAAATAPLATTPCANLPGASEFSGCYAQLVNQFFTDLASDGPAANVYGVTQQYGNNGAPDPSPRTYSFDAAANTIVIHDAWPADAAHANVNGCQASAGPQHTAYDWCVTDAQVQSELSSVLAAQAGRWPSDMSSVYFVMLPPRIDECTGPFAEASGANPCADTDFCAYHSNFSDAGGAPTAPLYALVAWPDVAGCRIPQSPNGDLAADSGIDLISHEHSEAVTDPLGNGWYSPGPTGAQDESGDKCLKTYAPALGSTTAGAQYNQLINHHGYYVQDEWANADPGNASFSAPNSTSGCEGRPQGANDPFPPNFTPPSGTVPLAYHGGPTVGPSRAYTIYWDGHPGSNPSAQIASAPTTVHRGDMAAFQAAPAADPQGQAPTYTWSFGDGTTAVGQSANHAYQVAGTYTVSLTVSDQDGYQASDTRTVRSLAPPVASFTAVNGPVIAGSPVDFNAGASAAPDGTITSWSWGFGDGLGASGAHVRHAYEHAGLYSATLTLTDSNGSTASESASVAVVPRDAPVLLRSGPPRTTRAGSHVLLVLGRTLSCPAGATPCIVTLSATTTRRVDAHRAAGHGTIIIRTVTIGSASLSPGAGSRTGLALRLDASGQALLRRLHRLVLSIHVVVRVPGANTATQTVVATVGYPPAPARRR